MAVWMPVEAAWAPTSPCPPVYRWPCSVHQLCRDSSSSTWLQGDSSPPVLVTAGLAQL